MLRNCLVIVALFLLQPVYSLKHHLFIHNDDRNVFKIETFGFVVGGEMEITVSDFSVHLTAKEMKMLVNSTSLHEIDVQHAIVSDSTVTNADTKIAENSNTTLRRSLAEDMTNTTEMKVVGSNIPMYLVGFVMRKAKSESAAQADLESIVERGQCILDRLQTEDVFVDLSHPDSWKKTVFKHEVSEDSAGLYSLIFARCHPAGQHFVNFRLDATFFNPGPNYLSAGDTPLPTLYLAFFALFTIALAVWCWVLSRDSATNGVVHRIHYMMLILLVLKCFSLFFESVRYHYISEYGVSEMWSIVYYIFAVLKGVMMFIVILLIGSGWSLMKSYLNDKEKRIVYVVLILQVLDNIAMIVLEETAPGSQGWQTWRDVLHLVDIICCCAILLPIVWSIRHLR